MLARPAGRPRVGSTRLVGGEDDADFYGKIVIVTSAHEALLEAVSTLSEEEAEDLLDRIHLLHSPDEQTEEDVRLVLKGREAVKRGDFVTLEQLKADLGL